MKFQRLLVFVESSPDYCFVSKGPIGMPPAYRDNPSMGIEVGAHYPGEPGAVGVPLDESTGGLELPSYVANTQSLVIVSARCAAHMSESFDLGKYEILPVRLINEKGRVHAEGYAMVNPIGSVDCVNKAKSKIALTPRGKVALIEAYALDSARIPEGRDLFRVPEYPCDYFFSQRLIDALASNGFTNFNFEPVEVC